MSHDPDKAIAFARERQTAILEDYKAVLRIPSVSTLSDRKADMQRAAEWAAAQFAACGMDAKVMPTGGHPVVFAERLLAGPAKPTVLFYGHYDVQPADPLDLWKSDPFEPQVRGENLYARGASDMKGQLVAFLKALEAVSRTGTIPVNLKVLVEGEEEIGSPSLRPFIADHKDLLRCDLCLNVDSGIQGEDTPAITYALRGLAYFEVRLQGAAGDLHSGLFGGVVDNPAIVLCQLIGGMRDAHGRITLPGFYDQVRPLSAEERADLARLPQTEAWWQQKAGARVLTGEEGYTPTERATSRPTLDVNGLLSGFIGQGSKTVLPAKAMAKISMRLVPDQMPEAVQRSLEAYLQAHVPPTMTWEVQELSHCRAAIVERDSEAVRAASRALQAVWGKAPLFVRQGGSVPVVGLIQELLGADSLLLGFGLPDDNLHAPNEKQHLPTFFRGVETYIRFLYLIAGEG